MVDEFIKKMLEAQTVLQLAHWQSKKFSDHEALGELYAEIQSITDKFVECYLGVFDSEEAFKKPVEKSISYIEEQLAWINKHRDSITKDSSSLENLIDEMALAQMRALYKLKNLG